MNKEETSNSDSQDANSSKKKGKKSSFWNDTIPKFEKGEMKHSLVAETSFETKFPEYREPYLTKTYPILKRVMNDHGIKLELDTNRGTISVRTTKKTWDPYSILLARDAIKLLSRMVDIQDAIKVFNEGIVSELVEIKKMVRDADTFKKRRNRLLGPENKCIIALQKLTGCKIVVQGHTAAVIGPYAGVAKSMEVITDAMRNIHPLHSLNRLFVQKELKENPDMKDEDWSKFLPQYKQNSTSKKKKKKIVKKVYNPLPPLPLESKADKKIEDGSVFVNENLFKKTKLSKEEQKAKSVKIQTAKRAKQYVAPVEPVAKKRKVDVLKPVNIENLKKKVKLQKKKLSAGDAKKR